MGTDKGAASQRQMSTLEAKISSYEKVLKVVGDLNGLSVDDLVGLALSEVWIGSSPEYMH